MLTQLELHHFKCFEHLKLPLRDLTLISGTNASGKSSSLQALVLLHQTILQYEWSRRLHLNGRELQLGTVADIVDKVTGRRAFSIGLAATELEILWHFQAADRREMSVPVVALTQDGVERRLEPGDVLQFLLPTPQSDASYAFVDRLSRLSYLTAERIGPRDVYPLKDPSSTQVVGPRGEHAASLLFWGGDADVLAPLRLADLPPTRLHQIKGRMRQFFPGCDLRVQAVPGANGVTLGIRTSDETDFHRPVHVGFGLTQVLPIIVATLSAQPGDIVLIENPEVHLHPAGQAAMGGFLSEVAAAGVQIIVETHSDHVLNGMRRAVKSGRINPNAVAVHFFRDRNADGAQVMSPAVGPDGNLDAWPSGFFDQFDKDMNFFAGWGD